MTNELFMPSALNPDGTVAEWDYCLPDCPHEKPEVVCEAEPIFPTLIYDDEDGNANFTTDYEIGDVIRELDFVTFSCPEGFHFNDTNDITVYATCHDWGWEYNYDLETFCKRKSFHLSGW